MAAAWDLPRNSLRIFASLRNFTTLARSTPASRHSSTGMTRCRIAESDEPLAKSRPGARTLKFVSGLQ